MKRLLDTNICVGFLKGTEPQLLERFVAERPGSLLLCSMVKAELIYGARRSQRVTANLERITDFFRNFDSLPFDDVAAEYYGVIRAQLEALGTPIGSNDLVIAATALSANVILVTRNDREFRRVAGLAVETW